jgi:hypothetical protein
MADFGYRSGWLCRLDCSLFHWTSRTRGALVVSYLHRPLLVPPRDQRIDARGTASRVGSGNSGRWIPEILAPSPERLAD